MIILLECILFANKEVGRRRRRGRGREKIQIYLNKLWLLWIIKRGHWQDVAPPTGCFKKEQRRAIFRLEKHHGRCKGSDRDEDNTSESRRITDGRYNQTRESWENRKTTQNAEGVGKAPVTLHTIPKKWFAY